MKILVVNEKLVDAVIWHESRGNASAISKKGAQGLMQIMPKTWREWCWKLGFGNACPNNPIINKKVGTAYLIWLLDQFENDLDLALAAYNWGIGNVKKLQKAIGESYEELEPHLPYETARYVDNVKARYLS